MTDRERPVRTLYFAVSDLPARPFGPEGRDIIGRVPLSGNGSWTGYVRLSTGGEVLVKTDDWEQVKVEEQVKPPGRGGREWAWKWSGLLTKPWIKDYYPRCRDCREYHNPALTYCEECYRCHKPGGKHR